MSTAFRSAGLFDTHRTVNRLNELHRGDRVSLGVSLTAKGAPIRISVAPEFAVEFAVSADSQGSSDDALMKRSSSRLEFSAPFQVEKIINRKESKGSKMILPGC